MTAKEMFEELGYKLADEAAYLLIDLLPSTPSKNINI